MAWKKATFIASCAACVSIGAPAAAHEAYDILTPSGLAEAIFSLPAPAVQAAIANGCLNNHWRVTANTESGVTCQHSDVDLTTALLSPRNATFAGIVQFTIVPLGDHVRVQGSDWVESTNVLGQTRQFKGDQQDAAQSLLIVAGGKYPEGTKFEGIDLGIDGYFPGYGFAVTKVLPGSPAADGGLAEGDLIRKINGHGFDSLWWFRHKVNKAAPGSMITFDITRAKQKLKVSVKAQVARFPSTP